MRSNIFLFKEKTELISPWAYKNLGHLKVGVVSHVSKTEKVQELTLAAIICSPLLPIDFKVWRPFPCTYFPLLSSCLPSNLLIIICFPMHICLQEENGCSALSKCVVNKLTFYVLSMWSLLWVNFSFWAFKAESQTQEGFPSSCNLLRDSKGFFFPQYHSAIGYIPHAYCYDSMPLMWFLLWAKYYTNICIHALMSPS